VAGNCVSSIVQLEEKFDSKKSKGGCTPVLKEKIKNHLGLSSKKNFKMIMGCTPEIKKFKNILGKIKNHSGLSSKKTLKIILDYCPNIGHFSFLVW